MGTRLIKKVSSIEDLSDLSPRELAQITRRLASAYDDYADQLEDGGPGDEEDDAEQLDEDDSDEYADDQPVVAKNPRKKITKTGPGMRSGSATRPENDVSASLSEPSWHKRWHDATLLMADLSGEDYDDLTRRSRRGDAKAHARIVELQDAAAEASGYSARNEMVEDASFGYSIDAQLMQKAGELATEAGYNWEDLRRRIRLSIPDQAASQLVNYFMTSAAQIVGYGEPSQ